VRDWEDDPDAYEWAESRADHGDHWGDLEPEEQEPPDDYLDMLTPPTKDQP
jgi:hypothetical protein